MSMGSPEQERVPLTVKSLFKSPLLHVDQKDVVSEDKTLGKKWEWNKIEPLCIVSSKRGLKARRG